MAEAIAIEDSAMGGYASLIVGQNQAVFTLGAWEYVYSASGRNHFPLADSVVQKVLSTHTLLTLLRSKVENQAERRILDTLKS